MRFSNSQLKNEVIRFSKFVSPGTSYLIPRDWVLACEDQQPLWPIPWELDKWDRLIKELQTHYFIACWLVVLSETESLSVLQKKVCASEDAKIVQTPLQGPPSRLSALKHIDSMQYRYKNWNAGSEFFFVLADTRDSIKVLDRTYCVVSLLSELDTGDWVVCSIHFFTISETLYWLSANPLYKIFRIFFRVI